VRSDELQAHLRTIIKRRREDLGLTAQVLERRLSWSNGSIDRIEDLASRERLGFLDLLELMSALELDPKSVIDGLAGDPTGTAFESGRGTNR
jgi:transcriptional regulator with XRE-family HTH domain